MHHENVVYPYKVVAYELPLFNSIDSSFVIFQGLKDFQTIRVMRKAINLKEIMMIQIPETRGDEKHLI